MTRRPRHRCRRCGFVPPHWADLTPPVRTVVSLLALGRIDGMDVPAGPSDVDLLRDYLLHRPHTAATGDLHHARSRAWLAGEI